MKEALKLALEALEHINDRFDLESVAQDATTAITAIKEALAQPEQKPVAHIATDALNQMKPPMLALHGVTLLGYNGLGTTAVYTTPPQREWVGLTDELRDKYFRQFERPSPLYAHGWNAALDEAAARIGEIKGFGRATQDSFAVFIKELKR